MNYFAVALGGFFGAGARDLLGKAVGSGYLPYGTLLINLAGSFLLLFLMTLLLERMFFGGAVLRLGLTSGFLGAFTTFSTLTKELLELLTRDTAAFVLYAVVSLAGGVLLGVLGRTLAFYLLHLSYARGATRGEE